MVMSPPTRRTSPKTPALDLDESRDLPERVGDRLRGGLTQPRFLAGKIRRREGKDQHAPDLHGGRGRRRGHRRGLGPSRSGQAQEQDSGGADRRASPIDSSNDPILLVPGSTGNAP